MFLLQPDDPIEVRWAHLSLLVEFALELKKALQSINEQSFNHFVLKMGECTTIQKRSEFFFLLLNLWRVNLAIF